MAQSQNWGLTDNQWFRSRDIFEKIGTLIEQFSTADSVNAVLPISVQDFRSILDEGAPYFFDPFKIRVCFMGLVIL